MHNLVITNGQKINVQIVNMAQKGEFTAGG